MKILYYIGFVLLSFVTLGAIDIDITFSNGQHLIRTGWLGFILRRWKAHLLGGKIWNLEIFM